MRTSPSLVSAARPPVGQPTLVKRRQGYNPAAICSPAFPPVSRSRRRFRCSSASGDTAVEAEAKKAQLFASVGQKKGFDLSEAELERVLGLVKELQAVNPTQNPAATDLSGTQWKCIFTTSKGPSSGKIGPWIGENDQEFPATEDGKYINTLALGPLQGYIKAGYRRAEGDVIRVEFIEQEFSLGPLKTKKEFEPNAMVGTWRMVYQDEDLRMFYTNKGSLFVMAKKE